MNLVLGFFAAAVFLVGVVIGTQMPLIAQMMMLVGVAALSCNTKALKGFGIGAPHALPPLVWFFAIGCIVGDLSYVLQVGLTPIDWTNPLKVKS